MLVAIREKATGWIAWVIAILITVPMALWGINSYFEGESEAAVAAVNGEEISIYAYQQDMQQQRQSLRQRFGESFDPAMIETMGIQQRVLDNLINNQLVSQYTAEQNFQISDAQLQEVIAEHPSFQVEGEFSLEQYSSILSANGYSPQSFERYQRVFEAGNQLRNGIADTGFVTRQEREKILALQAQRRIAQYAVITASELEDIEVSEEEIQDYYERNEQRFNTEPMIKVDYIELSVDALRETVEPTEQEIETHYEDTKERYKTAQSRKASHILIAANADLSEQERQEKRELAESLLVRVQDGEDFAELAKEHSEDPGSGQNGGDLGVVNRGQMVKPFEDAVFSMQEGDIEGLVETDFGFHIIKLTELREAVQKSLDEVREQVADELSAQQAENLFSDLAESFKNLVFEDPDNITTAADTLDLPVQQSEWFSFDSGTGIAENRAVRQAAFHLDVQDGLVSNAIEIGFEKLIAVQKIDFEPITLQPLEQVRDEVEQSIRTEKSQAAVLQRGSEIVTELEPQSTLQQWQSAMETNNLEIKDLPETKADYEPELSALAQAVFSSAWPESEQVAIGGVVLDNGDYAVYSIQEINQGEITEDNEALASNIDNQILAREGNEVYSEFLSMLRQSADVVIFDEQL